MWRVACVTLLTTAPAFAQGSSTFNGRVLDQGDAVLPGATVSATNVNTGLSRTTTTNAAGIYAMPGLDPGVYDIKAELSGFSPTTRNRVTLAVDATITLDFKLSLEGIAETLTVSGTAPLIEVSQSKVTASIQATEVASLPMVTRTFVGLVALLPGAKPSESTHRTKDEQGGVAFGGSAGRNLTPTVDGADNRDHTLAGPLMSFTLEALEEFRVSTHQFTAADGRNGPALSMATKSGTNTLHGSGFYYGRDDALISKDYFTKQANRDKAKFERQQYGGSIGGPIVRSRLFFFGAAEGVNEDVSTPVLDRQYNELLLVRQYGAKPVRERPRPLYNVMYVTKVNGQLTDNHSVMGRVAGQRWNRSNPSGGANSDLSVPSKAPQYVWSVVAQHSWVLGRRSLNQITAQVSDNRFDLDIQGADGKWYLANYPDASKQPPGLTFPSVTVGSGGGGYRGYQRMLPQVRDDLSVQLGGHALKMGGIYSRFPKYGLEQSMGAFGSFTFFHDPSVILSNSNGLYPQGFQTPGIVRQITRSPEGLVDITVPGVQKFATWFQDDWRVMPRLTLNLGVRYDLDLNIYGQRFYRQNATQAILAAIGSPYAGFPKTPTRDISPRAGFAFDLGGDGRRVVRGGYGLYFDYFSHSSANLTYSQNRPPFYASQVQTNTAIGVGQLATYRFGIDPVPPPPDRSPVLPNGSTGQWLDPNLSDPYNHQSHVGYSHELAPNMIVAADYTHIAGRNQIRTLELNPFVNGRRILSADFARIFGVANRLGPVLINSSINESRYDELTIQFQRRTPRLTIQVHYTLSGAYAYGGTITEGGGISSTAGNAQDAFNIFGPGEWGPTGVDERHSFVAFGVLEAPYGIQLSPIFQWRSPRPYTLLAGLDLNADGQPNDRYVDPATGQQVAINSAGGDETIVMDLRATKSFPVGGDRRIGVFAELFNVFNTVNFGNNYQGNAVSSLFRQPVGFIGGVGYPRQLQLGARFTF